MKSSGPSSMAINLPDFSADPRFIRLRLAMGLPADASEPLSPLEMGPADKVRLTGPDGLPVSLQQVNVAEDGTLLVKNERVIFYLCDVYSFEPRFHVANCSTLQEMRAQHRIARYVAVQTDTGWFTVNYIENNQIVRTEVKQLSVCRNCLTLLEWQGYHPSLSRTQKDQLVAGFELAGFFRVYPRSLQVDALKEASMQPANLYPETWAALSQQLRAHARWMCVQCGINLSAQEHRKFLHVHHRNGLKHDNSPQNLAVLCVGCHAQQPRHEHLKHSVLYAQYRMRFAGKTSVE